MSEKREGKNIMKETRKVTAKRCIALIAVVLLIFAAAPASGTAAQGDYINIPDPNFAAAVRRELGLPEGAPIPRARAADVTELWPENISSLAGIEYFTALEELFVSGNQLTVLDVSNNPALEGLWISGNNLTTLDVSHNPALIYLSARSNNLTTIDVSNNPALKSLSIDSNNLTTLDVSHNPALEWLFVGDNNLTTLDVSNNPQLRALRVEGNNLTTLDVSNNPLLGALLVSHNDMESPDDVIGWRDNENLTLDESFRFYPQRGVPSPWAAGYVDRAVELGLVPWQLNSAFTYPITRAAFAHLVVTLYETVTGRRITGWLLERFYDTDDEYVRKAAAIGVVQGVGDGRFNPTGTLTREQAATMLARLAYAIGSPLPEQAATFADNDAISYWAIDAVGQVQAAGIMGGVGDNRFAPSGSYTREQSIVTILRLFELLS